MSSAQVGPAADPAVPFVASPVGPAGPPARRIVLAHGEFARAVIGEAGAVRLVLLRGMVWATQEGDREDYVLHAGDGAHFDHPGLLLIEALGGAEIEIAHVRRGADGGSAAGSAAS